MLNGGGYDNHFGYEKWKVTECNLTKALVAKDSVNVMDMEASLCHRRLSHISKKWLNCLTKKDMLLGLKSVELKNCSHCMVGKQTRLLESVHYDVCGLLKVKSFSVAFYFVTFTSDCSRKLWVYTLKTKDQVLEKFKQFQALVERQLGKKVKFIHSNNGGEYCGPFDVYCKK
ncbi:hypothetical protein CR513_33945, partial [Mucuna pruriens]